MRERAVWIAAYAEGSQVAQDVQPSEETKGADIPVLAWFQSSKQSLSGLEFRCLPCLRGRWFIAMAAGRTSMAW